MGSQGSGSSRIKRLQGADGGIGPRGPAGALGPNGPADESVEQAVSALPGPIAYGIISTAGPVKLATDGVTSSWNNDGRYYEIAISGVRYHPRSYVTVVTSIGSPEMTEPSSTGSGRLIVQLLNPTRGRDQGSLVSSPASRKRLMLCPSVQTSACARSLITAFVH